MKRTLLVASISIVVLAAIPGIAQAHPAYKDSSPQWNASVPTPPSEVWVEFTERIEGGSVTIYDPCGERADHGEDALNLTKDRLTTGAHGEKAGTYVVKWAVLGADSHETRGEFTFSSTGGDECPSADPEPKQERTRPRNVQRPRTDDTGTGDANATSTGGTRPRGEGSSSDRRGQTEGKERPQAPTKRQVIVAQEPDATPDPTPAASIWEGIPIGDFLIALGVAALIGAAGGRIYAGIIGPRR